jgi:hypothetical protein
VRTLCSIRPTRPSAAAIRISPVIAGHSVRTLADAHAWGAHCSHQLPNLQDIGIAHQVQSRPPGRTVMAWTHGSFPQAAIDP